MAGLPVLQPRSCGRCTACCTVMEVRELGKPPGTPCPHLDRERPGCGRYETRPASCRAYACLWLGETQGLLRNMERPDQLGVMFNSPGGDHPLRGCVYAYEVRPGGYAEAERAIERLARGAVVVLPQPGGRLVLRGPPELVERARRIATT